MKKHIEYTPDREAFSVFVLANGLRCVHWRTHSQVSYCGIVVGAGSGLEPMANHGLAHFVEHTIFKGTARRSSKQIASRMETVGGELNAFTTKEETVIYTNAPVGYLPRSLELLSDLITASVFPGDELDKEREVVIEEIKSYLDTPADTVFDEFENRLFEGSSIGHPILGTEHSVRHLHRQDCLRWVKERYVPERMVVYCADPHPTPYIETQVNKYFGFMHHEPISPEMYLPAGSGFNARIDDGGHQAHTVMGCRVCSRYAPERFPLYLLNNYLGGPAMNSRLNLEMRDKRGLVYTVESSVVPYFNTGAFEVYFGSDIERTDDCIDLVCRELQLLADKSVSETTLERIKRQYIGQLLVASDYKESRIIGLAKSLLYYNELHDLDYTASRIERVGPMDFHEAAKSVLESGLSYITLF